MRKWMLGLVLLLAACSSEGIPKGTLLLSIEGLPAGLTPQVALSGPEQKTLSQPGPYELRVGSYTLQAADLSGPQGERYTAQQVTSPVEIKRGGKTEAKVIYALDKTTQPGSLSVLIGGLPEGAEASVSVKAAEGDKSLNLKASSTLKLSPGSYLVQAASVSFAGKRYVPSPREQAINLEAGKSATAQINYGPESGNLLVVVGGLPTGLAGAVDVKDGSGTLVASLGESRNLELPAGTYFVSAKPVQQGDQSYSGTVSSSPAQVNPGASATVQVLYAANPVPGLSLSANPTSLSVARGASGATTLTLTPQGGFTGTVNLSLLGAPSGVSLSPASVSVSGSGPVNQPVTLSVAPGTAAGNYTLTLQASKDSIKASTALVLTVPQPSFSFDISPTSLTLNPGSQGTVVANLTPQQGFSGTVSFSLLSAPAGVSLTANPVNLGGGMSVPLTLSVDSATAADTYPIVIQASGGGVSQTQTLTLTVRPAVGILAVSIQFTNAPPGAQGYVVVSGGNTNLTVTSSQTLALPPGTYTLTAFSVKVGSTTYAPSPTGTTVQLARGDSQSFTVVYAPAQ